MGKGVKFNPDDIISLARMNHGYGFRRFVKLMCGEPNKQPDSKNISQVMRVFDIHKIETGEDLFDSLQDTSRHKIVSLPEYMRITNSKFPPVGYGKGSGGRTPKPLRKGEQGRGIKVPLPPQVFHWGHIDPDGSQFVVEGRGKTNHLTLIDIRKFQSLYEIEMKTVEQISEIMGISKSWLLKLIDRMNNYDQDGILEDWITVIDTMYRVQAHRGKGHFEDELMAEFRGIFRDYVENPDITEKPTVEDIIWVYNQLLSEEK